MKSTMTFHTAIYSKNGMINIGRKNSGIASIKSNIHKVMNDLIDYFNKVILYI